MRTKDKPFLSQDHPPQRGVEVTHRDRQTADKVRPAATTQSTEKGTVGLSLRGNVSR